MYGSEIVVRELQDLAQRIADNIARNGQTASGKTARSLEVVEGQDEMLLLGRKYFDNLERGVPPWSSINKNKIHGFASILYRWSQDKGISFADDKERTSFAFALAYKIANKGTQLFRNGGRADVYSNEIPKTIDNIARKLADEVVMKFETIKLNTK